MLRAILIQAIADLSTRGLAMAATFGATCMLLAGWSHVEVYLRGRRDGRREAPAKPVAEPAEAEWEC